MADEVNCRNPDYRNKILYNDNFRYKQFKSLRNSGDYEEIYRLRLLVAKCIEQELEYLKSLTIHYVYYGSKIPRDITIKFKKLVNMMRRLCSQKHSCKKGSRTNINNNIFLNNNSKKYLREIQSICAGTGSSRGYCDSVTLKNTVESTKLALSQLENMLVPRKHSKKGNRVKKLENIFRTGIGNPKVNFRALAQEFKNNFPNVKNLDDIINELLIIDYCSDCKENSTTLRTPAEPTQSKYDPPKCSEKVIHMGKETRIFGNRKYNIIPTTERLTCEVYKRDKANDLKAQKKMLQEAAFNIFKRSLNDIKEDLEYVNSQIEDLERDLEEKKQSWYRDYDNLSNSPIYRKGEISTHYTPECYNSGQTLEYPIIDTETLNNFVSRGFIPILYPGVNKELKFTKGNLLKRTRGTFTQKRNNVRLAVRSSCKNDYKRSVWNWTKKGAKNLGKKIASKIPYFGKDIVIVPFLGDEILKLERLEMKKKLYSKYLNQIPVETAFNN